VWASVTLRTDPDGAGPATNFGYNSYAAIQDAVNHVNTGAAVNIAAGTCWVNVVKRHSSQKSLFF
jgi:hypothetical protein